MVRNETDATGSRELLVGILLAGGIEALVEASLKCRNMLDQISLDSYEHPNGFDKIVIRHAVPPPNKLVIHVWWKRPKRAWEQGDIHNHRWSFTTCLLYGAYRVKQFAISRSGMRYHEYRYSSPGNGKVYRLDYLGAECVNNFETPVAGSLVSNAALPRGTVPGGLHRIHSTSTH
ncbi:MAG: hypothetical protein ACREBC_26420, partial [Pyrinomonadaceae bacterium]